MMVGLIINHKIPSYIPDVTTDLSNISMDEIISLRVANGFEFLF